MFKEVWKELMSKECWEEGWIELRAALIVMAILFGWPLILCFIHWINK